MGVATREGFSEEGTWKVDPHVLSSFVNSGTNLVWEAFPSLKFSLCKLGTN